MPRRVGSPLRFPGKVNDVHCVARHVTLIHPAKDPGILDNLEVREVGCQHGLIPRGLIGSQHVGHVTNHIFLLNVVVPEEAGIAVAHRLAIGPACLTQPVVLNLLDQRFTAIEVDIQP